MTDSELEALREKLTRAILDIMDDAFASTEVEQEGIALNPPKPVRWGKADPADYGTPTTIRVDESVLVRRAAARLAGGAPMPLVMDKDGNVLDDGLDDWIDPQEGRFDRED